MRKKLKSSKQSSKTVSNTPTDATVTASTTASDAPPLPSVREALSKLATPDPAPSVPTTDSAGNGKDPVNGHGTHHPAPPAAPAVLVTPIQKPDGRDGDDAFLEKFRSKTNVALACVESNTDKLPHHRLVDAKDFVRLHPDAAYWSPELCFISVPIIGQKKDTLHLIDEELAMEYLPPGIIQRFRLALATMPYDVLFLCEVPTQNLDNKWNATNIEACEKAKTLWTMVTSRRSEGVENYKIDYARDPKAFPEPWQKPLQSLSHYILRTFSGAMIEDNKHPGLLRRIGGKLDLK